MPNIVEGVLRSRLMQRRIPFRVMLPHAYHESRKFYPVLYLLHGLFGSRDNWLELTDLKNHASDSSLIIVLPEGEDGWYTDSATGAADRFESYLVEELIPEIDLLYKTCEKRESRAVAGLSMGGYGALKLGLKRPDLFAFAASISGAFSAPLQTEETPGFDWENLAPSILKAFGEEKSPTRAQNDLFQIIEQFPFEKLNHLPHFHLVCGTEDGFLTVNRQLAETLRKKKIAFEYLETTGGHDWSYWDREIRNILPLIEGNLSSEDC